MPQIIKIGSYIVYFWSKESEPLEPVHVHIAEGTPVQNATKAWITKSGKTLIANNNSHISEHRLQRMLRIIEANSDVIIERWKEYFGEIRYFC